MVALALTAALLSAHAVAAPANPFKNTRNTPFAARCTGPQGAIVISDDGVGPASAARGSALATQHSAANLAHAAATVRRLQKAGLQSAEAEVRLPRLVVHTRGGELVLPDLERAVKRFQASTGLTPTGLVDQRPIAALNVPASARHKQPQQGLQRHEERSRAAATRTNSATSRDLPRPASAEMPMMPPSPASAASKRAAARSVMWM